MALLRRHPLLLACGALAVIAVVVVIVLTTGGADRDSPENVAQAAVDTFNDHGPNDMRTLTCAGAPTEWKVDLTGSIAEVRTVTMAGDHKATADLRFTDPTGNPYIDMDMTLTERTDGWCISSFEGWSD